MNRNLSNCKVARKKFFGASIQNIGLKYVHFFALKVVNGKLSYNFNEVLVVQIPHISVNDTRWHHVKVLWTYTALKITVDYIYEVSVPSSYGNNLGEVNQFFFGARKNSTTSTVYGGFRGCMQGMSKLVNMRPLGRCRSG